MGTGVTAFELKRLKLILDDCKYPNLKFELCVLPTLGLRVTDHYGKMMGRFWVLDFDMTPGEIVQTAFLAVRTWTEHEVREQFTYADRAVFGPHLDIIELCRIAGIKNNR